MASSDELRRCVVDASVAAKWFLDDEAEAQAAAVLLADFRESRVQLLAPAHIHYQVASAIGNAIQTRRLTVNQARESIEIFLDWRIPVVGGPELVLAGYDLSITFGCSLYDGLYLALAQASGSQLIYADARLRNAIGERFPPALWLTDYVPGDRR